MILNNKEQKIYDEIDEIVMKNYNDKKALTNRLFEYVNKKINSPKIDIKVDTDPAKVLEALATLNRCSVSRTRGSNNE